MHRNLQLWQGCFSLLQALCVTAFCTCNKHNYPAKVNCLQIKADFVDAGTRFG